MLNRVGGRARAAAGRVVDAVARRAARQFEDRFAGLVRQEVDRAIREVHELEFRARRDTLAAGERHAALEASQFADEHMPTARVFHDPQSTLAYALEIAPQDGMALEFGVFMGRSLTMIAKARNGREVYGFDSFKGLPEDYRQHVREGAFGLDAVPEIEGAELVVGWFDETLPGFMAAHPGPVSFLHVDGDLYSSTKTIFEHVGSRLRVGSVIVFDEFFNYPGWRAHEYRAWEEFIAESGIEAVYEAYTSNNEQVVARLTTVPATG